MIGDVHTWHSVWEADHPVDAAHARAIAQHRHNTGQAPNRDFPCRGALRHQDDLGTIACDRCNFRTVIQVKERAHAW